MAIEARFRCMSRKVTHPNYLEVVLAPVYSPDESHPNHAFWKATPSGELKMNLNTNETSADFTVGAVYSLMFNFNEVAE